MFTIVRHFSKIVQPVSVRVTNNQYLDKYHIIKHNLNVIKKNMEENNISYDDIKIIYDNDKNKNKNKSVGVICFKYTFLENGTKYNGKIYFKFTSLQKLIPTPHNVSEEDENEHKLALKHAWSN